MFRVSKGVVVIRGVEVVRMKFGTWSILLLYYYYYYPQGALKSPACRELSMLSMLLERSRLGTYCVVDHPI